MVGDTLRAFQHVEGSETSATNIRASNYQYSTEYIVVEAVRN